MASYWSASAALAPWCVAQPTVAEDVSTILKTLVANNCPFGVRGGGHGSFGGSNSVADGVTIDFGMLAPGQTTAKKQPGKLTRTIGNINATTYDATTKIASVRPGAHWQEVYDTLSPLGATVAGGRSGAVGVGGFVGGGGNSFYSASHGMACDTVQNFEVVLANGTIVNANAAENSDLFRALKGGSGNFGLVTRFDMYAIEFPDVENPVIWGGLLEYDVSAGDDVLDAMVSFTDNAANDQNTTSIIIWAYKPSVGLVLHVALENTVGTENPAAADGYLGVSGIKSNTLRKDELTVITAELGSGQPPGLRNIWFTLLIQNDADVMRYVTEAHEYALGQLSETMSADSEFNTLCMFQPMNHIIAQHGAERGGNVMGLDAALDGENGIMFLATLAVLGQDNEALALPIMQNWTDSVAAYSAAAGDSFDWHYLNYAYANQDPLAKAGSDSVAVMQAVSAKYDPDGVFQKLRTSGFKIPAA